MRRAVLVVVSLVAVWVAACAPVTSHSCDAPARRHVPFVDRMRCAGLEVGIGERISVPYLRPAGTTLLVSGGAITGTAELRSFDYDDTDLGTDGRSVAVADLQKLAPDGSPRDTSMRVSYAGTPHLYWNDRLIVIYAGDDPAVLAVLGGLLGMQFAGG